MLFFRRKRILWMLMLSAVFLLLPVFSGTCYAAVSGIEFTQTAQKTSCVYLRWKQVKNADYYLVQRTEAMKSGTLIQEKPKQWRTKAASFEDSNGVSGKSGRVFQYTVTAMDKQGRKLAEGSSFLVKITSTFFTTCASDGGDKVLLKWGKVGASEGYRVQWVKGKDFTTGAVKSKTLKKDVFSLTVPGLERGQTYSFRIQTIGKGYHRNKGTGLIVSYSATSTKSLSVPAYKDAKIVFHQNDGSVIRTVTVPEGVPYSLPGMENPTGTTFMGWGRQKGMITRQEKPVPPDYEALQQISGVKGTLHLYAVLMNRSEEKDLTPAQLAAPDLSAYRQVIFVGDSRTARMERTLGRQKVGYKGKSIAFVAKPGAGLTWLEDTGYGELLEVLDSYDGASGKAVLSDGSEGTGSEVPEDMENGDGKDSRPAAVIFNLGINDLGHDPAVVSERYISYMKRIAPELERRNCRLYYMSVNPINSLLVKKATTSDRKEWRVRSFNGKIRAALADHYTYINMYTWLMRTGYSTDASYSGQDTGVDDGLHYTTRTYKRIYLKCLQILGL